MRPESQDRLEMQTVNGGTKGECSCIVCGIMVTCLIRVALDSYTVDLHARKLGNEKFAILGEIVAVLSLDSQQSRRESYQNISKPLLQHNPPLTIPALFPRDTVV